MNRDEQLHEACRLRAMQDSRLMYSPIEERFDRITRIAKALFATDAAFLTLMDEQHLWFKSMQGFSKRQILRESSFCEYVIVEQSLLVVEDALLDQRFLNAEIVKNLPHIRFYAGYPIFNQHGVAIGTLCIADREPRRFSSEQVQQLIDLAAWAQTEAQADRGADNWSIDIPQQQRPMLLDRLTGLWNKEGFWHLLGAQQQYYRMRKMRFALALIDFDHFAWFREQSGDATADDVLMQTAALLQKKCGSTISVRA